MKGRNDKLGTEKISKLLFKLSLPAALAMTVNGLYNIVDAIFIGRGVGALGIGGLAIAFPIQMLIMGFAQMVGIGGASAISRSLGEGNEARAQKVTGNAFVCIFVLSSLLAIVGLTFTDQLLIVFGATENILPYARDYVRIIFMGSVFFAFAMACNNLIRSEGNAKAAMVSMIIGAGLNIILDPIFIFVLDLGMKGAALATVIAQFTSFMYVMNYMRSPQSSLRIKLHHLKPQWDIVKEILSVGFSAFARSSTSTIFSIVVNNSLRLYGGDIAITIFGIVNKTIAFLFMPILGVVQGMQPIAGFNYGAKKIDRVKEVLKLAVMATTGLAIIGWIIGQAFPHIIVGAFTDEAEIVARGGNVFRIVTATIPLIGLQLVGATLFQTMGKPIPALILSLLRQFITLTPLILILPRLFNLELLGVWIAFPVADVIAFIITLTLMKSEMKKLNIEEQAILNPLQES
ncbi:MAG: MATE family efflux transporter [Clostridiaceae bacterium]|nr:MATE family efflux transporter [Clostridiaceae bacterium]